MKTAAQDGGIGGKTMDERVAEVEERATIGRYVTDFKVYLNKGGIGSTIAACGEYAPRIMKETYDFWAETRISNQQTYNAVWQEFMR
ncbi:MAG: hypothetical protein Q8O89_04295 [Nanoarchaeota archaeon]|nr:hypothetical protein [Nanoarchaeota archaeon]